MRKGLSIIIFITVITFINIITPVFAAETYQVNDQNVVDGDIVVSTPNGLKLAAQPYDSNIFGVVQSQAVIVWHSGNPGEVAIASNGMAMVNVTTANGPIKFGDYVTSSSVPGKGQKAANAGYVLGIAQENFDGNGTTSGQIPVVIKVEYAGLSANAPANKLFEFLGASLLANAANPEKFGTIIRYTLAGLVLLAGFGFGFITFSRSLPKGVEAIGRNPLAKNTIYLSMILNVILILVVGGISIVGALLILRL